MLKSLNEAHGLKGKRVLLRLDFNVPIARGKITDDFRIQTVIPTINQLRDAGARIIILSHIEGKAGTKTKAEANTLKPIVDYLVERKIPVTFVSKYFVSATQKAVDNMKDGEVLLFENIRINKGETENDEIFARKLALFGDVYVNEAFPVSHRAHASIVGLPKLLPSYAGPVFMREVKNLSEAFRPEKPFLFILGGAKFDTKMPLIQKFMNSADYIFVGGALANNFFKELGYEVGKSTVSEGNFNLPELLKTKKVFIPTDVVAVSDGPRKTKSAQRVSSSEKILDVGPLSLNQIAELARKAKFILWNGPLGNYEDGYSESTQKLVEIISKTNARSIVGGGDTVAAIKTLGLMKEFSFVSTGGGAMLDFLAEETLPGIEALKNSK